MSDYDRNKFYNKKKFTARDPVNFGSRFFNSKSTGSPKDAEKADAKPKSIKKTTILAREHHAEERAVSPKNTAKEGETAPTITIATASHPVDDGPGAIGHLATLTTAEKNASVKLFLVLAGVQHRVKEMTKCTKFLDEGVIIPENIQDYLQENDDYLVVGIVGTQGVGKSTILNLLAHNNITEKLKKSIFQYSETSKQNDNIKIFSDYSSQKISETDVKPKVDDIIFKPQGLLDIASNSNGTYGIDFFVTHNRVMFLDCQPFASVAVLDEFIRSEAKLSNMVSEFTPLENSGEIQGLQMTAFLMSVCHVLVLVQDWFCDSNIIRFIQSAEMLKPTISNPEDELIDHFPHLILIQNRAQMEDFSPKKFKTMQQAYKSFFSKTKMHIDSGMGIGCGRIINSLSPEICGNPINLFLIPDYDENIEHLYKGHPPLEELVKKLRSNILGATKYPLNNTSEKHWLVYCSKVWDHIKKSNFFVEYNKLMP